jgi:solute carrier family 45 protein 1/2/4
MEDTSNSGQANRSRNAPRTAPPDYATSVGPGYRPLHARAASTPIGPWHSTPASPARPTERSQLIRSYSTADLDEGQDSMEYTGSGPVAGGTIMGIHNLAIVFPQFIVSSSPTGMPNFR